MKADTGTNSRSTEEEGIISKFRATIADYLLYTFYTIFTVKNPTFDRRSNNLIFNNRCKITQQLTKTVFLNKAREILAQDLSSTNFVSCIYHPEDFSPSPVFVQFFDPMEGVQLRILDFATKSEDVNSIISYHGVMGKIVGFCGDYSFIPGVRGTTVDKSDQFVSLTILNGREIRYLPYSDGFVERLIDLLVSYFPEDVTAALTKLGESLAELRSRSPLVLELSQKFNAWRHKKQHILASDYTKFVVDNLPRITSYLEDFQHLPRSVTAVLNTMSLRFLLVFIREVFILIDNAKSADNNAVSYQYHLGGILNMFKLYEDTNYVPQAAKQFLDSELHRLREAKNFDDITNQTDVDKLFKKITEMVDMTYTRATAFLEAFLDHFKHFDSFYWVLLKTSSVDSNLVHETFHIVSSKDCQNCPQLFKEVSDLNRTLQNMSLVDMQEQELGTKWIHILKHCSNIPNVTMLVKYLLSLPSSINMTANVDSVTTMIQLNIKPSPEIEEDIEGFLGSHANEADEIIKRLQVPLMEDYM